MDIKKVFDKVELKFWLFHGTLLGAIRDNDWIPWDDDVDVCVMEEDFKPKLKIIREEFMSLGFIVRDPGKSVGTKLNIYRYRQKNSIDGLFLDPKYENNKYRLSRRVRYPRELFEREQTIVFKGTVFNVPSPPEKFLSWHYKNWKTPVKMDRPLKERINVKKTYYYKYE
jgi:phosphorylcholine metabolism protein LicD